MSNDYVILLHGILFPSMHMQKLTQYLKKKGFDTININYPSTQHSIEELVDIIYKKICQKTKETKPIHFIGYSLGGILVRAIIEKYTPENLGRVVQLAPPNKGSEVADFFKNNWIYKKIFGPAGQQLTTESPFLRSLPADVSYELGVIAGCATLGPISSFLLIKNANDGKVSVENTKINGMKDHLIIRASHTLFPLRKKVMEQTVRFLETGSFDHKNS